MGIKQWLQGMLNLPANMDHNNNGVVHEQKSRETDIEEVRKRLNRVRILILQAEQANIQRNHDIKNDNSK